LLASSTATATATATVMADYNIKCNTSKKDRQYSNQGVKCSYHTNIFNGGKNIVLHSFYTI
jgi:hypothetical protein